MEKQLERLINAIHKKVSPVVPLMLLIKYYSIKSVGFYIFITIVKFFPGLIISSSFILSHQTNNSFITSSLRIFSANAIITNGMCSSLYFTLCVIVYCIQLLLTGYNLHYYIHFKQKKTNKLSFSYIYFILLHFHITISQFVIEFLSYVYFIYWFKPFSILNTFTSNQLVIISIINGAFILLINVNTIMILRSINTPFNQKSYPIQMRLPKYTIVFIFFIENLSIFESFELYFSNHHLKIYQIIISALIIIALMTFALISLTKYNFDNMINLLVAFLISLIFTSMIIEIAIYSFYSNCLNISSISLLMILLCKIILSLALVFLFKSFNAKVLTYNSKTMLFKIYESELNKNTIDSFLYLVDKLKQLQQGKPLSYEFLSIIYDHQLKCYNEKCKCQLIQIFHFNTRSNSREFIRLLMSRIGFLIETAFVQIDYSSNFDLTVFLSEYFFKLKSNPIMAYSIIQTFMHSNIKTMSLDKTVIAYSLLQKYILYCNKRLRKTSVNFSEVYVIYRRCKEVNKQLMSFCESYKKMIELKESFEGSIKVTYDYESGEMSNIISSFLTTDSIEMIIDIIKNNTLCYMSSIQFIIESNPLSMPIEHLITLNLFFHLFNSGKLPKKVKEFFDEYLNFNVRNSCYTKYNATMIDLTSILSEQYNNKLYSSNIIVKLANRFSIEYISEKLCLDLGFIQSSILKADLDVLIPKEIRQYHHQAIVNFLIVNNHFSHTHKSYIFTAQRHSIPCTLAVSTLPGLSKDFNIVCNVLFKHIENKFSFILNEDFETVSISESFDKKYGFSLQLINNFDINLLELFNLKIDSIKSTFIERINEIKTIKRLNDVSTKVAFAQWLFNKRNRKESNDNEHCAKKFKALEEQKDFKAKANDLNQTKKDIELSYSIQGTENTLISSFNEIRTKSNFLQNLIKLIAKFNEMEVYDERYKKLNEALYKLRLSVKNDHTTNRKKRSEANAINQYNSKSFFDIKVEIKCLYDHPIFIVKLIELYGNIPKADLNKKATSNKSNDINDVNKTKSKNTETKYTQSKNSFNRKITFQRMSSSASQSESNTNLNVNVSNEIIELNKLIPNHEPMTIQQKIQSLLSHIKNSVYVNQNKDIRREIKKKRNEYPSYKYLLGFMLLCLFVSFGLILLNYTLQIKLLATDHLLFQNLFSLNYQRDKYLSLYCLTISLLYKISTLSSLSSNITINNDLNDYYSFLKETAKGLDNSYHIFYSSYLNYKEQAKLPYTEMFFQETFIQIKLNWVEIKYESDYFTEMQFFNILYNRVVFNKEDISDLNIDVDQFLFDRFLLYQEQEVRTDYARLLYYLGSNYVTSYEGLFDLLISSIHYAFKHHHMDSVWLIISFEIVILLIYLSFYGAVMYYLIIHNDLIFRSILKMFIYSSPGDEYNSKHYYYNFSLKLKIRALMNLMSDFNIDYLTTIILGEKIKISFNDLDMSQLRPSYKNLGAYRQNTKNMSTSKVNKDIGNVSNKMLKYSESSQSITVLNDKHHKNNNKINYHEQNQTNNAYSSTNNSNNLICNSSNNTNANILSTSVHTTTKSKLINNTNASKDEKELKKGDFIKFAHNSGVRIVKALSLCLFGFFVIFMILFSLNISSIFAYRNSIERIFLDFSDFINYYSLIYVYFNELRIKFISPAFLTSDRLLNNMTSKIDDVTREIDVLLHTRLSIFPETFTLIERLNANRTSLSQSDIDYFCNANLLCIKIFQSNSNELLSKGINIGINAMFLQMTNIYKDYTIAKEDIKTIEDIKLLLHHNHFIEIEQILDFVLNNIKDNLYKALEHDEHFIEDSFKNEVLVYTIIAICYCILVLVVIMSVIIFNIQSKIKFIMFGSYKFNQSFLYSFLVDSHYNEN